MENRRQRRVDPGSRRRGRGNNSCRVNRRHLGVQDDLMHTEVSDTLEITVHIKLQISNYSVKLSVRFCKRSINHGKQKA
jgi:hypothetical protein